MQRLRQVHDGCMQRPWRAGPADAQPRRVRDGLSHHGLVSDGLKHPPRTAEPASPPTNVTSGWRFGSYVISEKPARVAVIDLLGYVALELLQKVFHLLGSAQLT